LHEKTGPEMALSSHAAKSDKETCFMPRSQRRMKKYIQNKYLG